MLPENEKVTLHCQIGETSVPSADVLNVILLTGLSLVHNFVSFLFVCKCHCAVICNNSCTFVA